MWNTKTRALIALLLIPCLVGEPSLGSGPACREAGACSGLTPGVYEQQRGLTVCPGLTPLLSSEFASQVLTTAPINFRLFSQLMAKTRVRAQVCRMAAAAAFITASAAAWSEENPESPPSLDAMDPSAFFQPPHLLLPALVIAGLLIRRYFARKGSGPGRNPSTPIGTNLAPVVPEPSFSFADREKWIKDTGRGTYDLAVIGAGAAGLAAAVFAARMGLKTVVVDRGDMAGETSSHSTGLAHAGLRYLPRYLFYVAREMRERMRLGRIAPDYLRPARFVLPVYDGERHSLQKVWIGVGSYDRLARLARREKKDPPFERPILYSPRQLLKLFPTLAAEGLQGGVEYFTDAHLDDARYTLALAQEAAGLGVKVLTYAEVTALGHDGQTARLQCTDRLSSEPRTFEVKAHHVLNAAGPWIDGVRKKAGVPQADKPVLLKSQGIHLVVDRIEGGRLSTDDNVAVVFPSASSPLLTFFGVKHLDARTSLVATTDITPAADPDLARPTEDEINDLVRELLIRFPALNVGKKPMPEAIADYRRQHVRQVYWGVRPIARPADADGKSTQNASRDHRIIREGWLWSLPGVKLTGALVAGEQMASRIFRALKGRAPPKVTLGRLPENKTQFESLAEQVHYAVHREMTLTLNDFLWCRTRWARLRDLSADDVYEIAGLIADQRGIPNGERESWVADQIADFQTELARHQLPAASRGVIESIMGMGSDVKEDDERSRLLHEIHEVVASTIDGSYDFQSLPTSMFNTLHLQAVAYAGSEKQSELEKAAFAVLEELVGLHAIRTVWETPGFENRERFIQGFIEMACWFLHGSVFVPKSAEFIERLPTMGFSREFLITFFITDPMSFAYSLSFLAYRKDLSTWQQYFEEFFSKFVGDGFLTAEKEALVLSSFHALQLPLINSPPDSGPLLGMSSVWKEQHAALSGWRRFWFETFSVPFAETDQLISPYLAPVQMALATGPPEFLPFRFISQSLVESALDQFVHENHPEVYKFVKEKWGWHTPTPEDQQKLRALGRVVQLTFEFFYPFFGYRLAHTITSLVHSVYQLRSRLTKKDPLGMQPNQPDAGPRLSDVYGRGEPVQLGRLDRPTKSVFWNFWINLRHHAGVPPHEKATSLASAGVVSDVLYNTNADEIVLVAKIPLRGKSILQDKGHKREVDRYVQSSGFQDSADASSMGMFHSFIYDLHRLGIHRSEIKELGFKDDGCYVVTFSWAYPGEEAVIRTVYFYPDWDITERKDVPLHAQGSRILFQKGSEALPAYYHRYLPKYLDAMADDAWIETDDLAYDKQFDLEKSMPDYTFMPVHTRLHSMPQMSELGAELIAKTADLDTYARYGYGWDVLIRRLIRLKSEPERELLPDSVEATDAAVVNEIKAVSSIPGARHTTLHGLEQIRQRLATLFDPESEVPEFQTALTQAVHEGKALLDPKSEAAHHYTAVHTELIHPLIWRWVGGTGVLILASVILAGGQLNRIVPDSRYLLLIKGLTVMLGFLSFHVALPTFMRLSGVVREAMFRVILQAEDPQAFERLKTTYEERRAQQQRPPTRTEERRLCVVGAILPFILFLSAFVFRQFIWTADNLYITAGLCGVMLVGILPHWRALFRTSPSLLVESGVAGQIFRRAALIGLPILITYILFMNRQLVALSGAVLAFGLVYVLRHVEGFLKDRALQSPEELFFLDLQQERDTAHLYRFIGHLVDDLRRVSGLYPANTLCGTLIALMFNLHLQNDDPARPSIWGGAKRLPNLLRAA